MNEPDQANREIVENLRIVNHKLVISYRPVQIRLRSQPTLLNLVRFKKISRV